MQFFGNNIIGVDEAGRGPLAGPVVAAAVKFYNQDFDYNLIRDSKKLSPKKRLLAYELIIANANVGLEVIDVVVIDKINILNAAMLALANAALKITMQDFEKIIIDGNKIPSQLEHLNCQAIIKGDNQFYEIAAASIIAKVTRDELMIEYSKQHPDYDWHNNFGYGTLKHLEAIEKIGITEHHRRSFAPIKNLL